MAFKALVGDDGIQGTSVPMTPTQNWTIMCWSYIDTTSEQGILFEVGNDQNIEGSGYGIAVGNTTGYH